MSMDILWIPVRSSNIAAISYDRKTQTLFVKFVQSGTYKYFDVPELIYKEMVEAESVGKFFFEKIKRFFDYEKEEEKDVLSNRST